MNQHIYAQLAVRRRVLGLSQAELAARAGVRREKISRLESKGEDASFYDMCRIIDALGLEIVLSERRSPAPDAQASRPSESVFREGFFDGSRAKILDWGKAPR